MITRVYQNKVCFGWYSEGIGGIYATRKADIQTFRVFDNLKAARTWIEAGPALIATDACGTAYVQVGDEVYTIHNAADWTATQIADAITCGNCRWECSVSHLRHYAAALGISLLS